MGSVKVKRVLIVDDNVESAEVLKETLERAGHSVVTAHDPVAALRNAEDVAPDVCILDIELPVMNGYELGTRLHETESTKDCVLIAVTGYGQEHDRRRSRDAGFEHHLVKPVDVDRLLQIVEEVPALHS